MTIPQATSSTQKLKACDPLMVSCSVISCVSPPVVMAIIFQVVRNAMAAIISMASRLT